MRCPDIAAIKQQLKNSRDKLQICQFGLSENECKTFQDYVMLRPKERLNRRCDLCMNYEIKNNKRVYKCIKAQERWNNSNKTKHFAINNDVYRKVSSAGHYLMKTTQYKTLFLTLTFPKWKNNFNPYKNENTLNECFSKFVENLREHYSCSGYIAVRELAPDTRRYHYHLICSIPFTPFAALNRAWCSAISDICVYSKNALSSNKETRLININTPGRAVRYICKYISKAKNQRSKTRLVFISNNLFRKPVAIRNYENELSRKTGIEDIETYLYKLKSFSVKKINDYCTAFRINENSDFDKLCSEILYPLFNLTPEKKVNLYAFPLNTS